MITRSMRLRHGRIAIARPASSLLRQRQRTISPRQTKVPEFQGEYDTITADFKFLQHKRRQIGKIGATVEPHYKPNTLALNPPKPDDITLELLLASQTHLGHRTSLWHPANSRYIHGVWGQEHDAIHIISLDVTAAHLRRACKVVEGVAAKGGLILFVGTRDGHALPVVRAAKLAKGYHLFDKWRPGTITNAEQILGKCKKVVVNELDQEVLGFDRQMSTRAAIKPDLVVCLNPLENYVLLHECGLHNIPTIGIIDTDVNPTWVTYPIPANDDSIRSVSVIAGALGHAGQAGQALRMKRAEQGHIDFVVARDLEVPSIPEVQHAKRLKENPEMEDREEDEYELLSAEEQELYRTVEPAKVTPQAEEGPEDLSDAVEETDDSLASLTGLSAEEGTPLLSAEEVTELAETIEDHVENISADAAAESAIEEQIRQDAPDSFKEIANNSPVTKLADELQATIREAEADTTRPTAQAVPETREEIVIEGQLPGEHFSEDIPLPTRKENGSKKP